MRAERKFSRNLHSSRLQLLTRVWLRWKTAQHMSYTWQYASNFVQKISHSRKSPHMLISIFTTRGRLLSTACSMHRLTLCLNSIFPLVSNDECVHSFQFGMWKSVIKMTVDISRFSFLIFQKKKKRYKNIFKHHPCSPLCLTRGSLWFLCSNAWVVGRPKQTTTMQDGRCCFGLNKALRKIFPLEKSEFLFSDEFPPSSAPFLSRFFLFVISTIANNEQ